MASGAKRVRSSNYSLEEKNVLISLVNKYKHVIENKKTDGVTNRDKEQVWVKITDEFNSVSPNNLFRDLNSLKKMYINLKKTVRKEVADEKIQLFKTGGGPSQSTHNPLRDVTLQTINQKTVFGLHNNFDGDNVFKDNTTRVEVADAVEPELIILEDIEDQVESETWNKWNPANLKTPVSAALQQSNSKELPTTSTTPHSSRRRPVAAVAMQSNQISKVYCDLAEKRLAMVNLEYEAVQNREKREAEKHEIEQKSLQIQQNILQVELQIKLEELKKLNPNWVETFMHNK